MKILHVNSNYLTSKLHENLLDQVTTKDIDHLVYMPRKPEKENEFVLESKHEVLSPVTFKDRDKFFFAYKSSKIWRKLMGLVNFTDFDLVHAHTLFTDGNIALKIKEKYGLPYLVTVRSFTDIDNFFKYRVNLRARGRKILKEASQIVFLSEASRRKLLNSYIPSQALKEEILEKSVILPNGIDQIYFEEKGSAKSLSPDRDLTFIQVGKIFKRKNALNTVKGIRAFSQKTGRKVKLLLVGPIEDQAYFEQVQAQAGAILDYQPPAKPPQLIDYYRQADIFIMPSYQETFGLVYPEAMSQGLPVIYSKGEGFDGQFPEGQVGYPVRPGHPEDIVKAIEKILENYEEISENVLDSYQKFNWQEIGQDYLRIYREIGKK